MGIESDQVVYEYLSRVGDVAQQRQLPSGTRMRLVSELRNEIDRRRAKVPVDSPAAVRRIIARLGSPDDVVTAAGGTSSGGDATGTGAVPQARTAPAPTAVPAQRDRDTGTPRPKGLRRIVPVPKPRPAETVDEAPAPPHLASEAEIGNSALQPDWWRTDSTPFGVGESLPAGFVGGVEIPELLKPRRASRSRSRSSRRRRKPGPRPRPPSTRFPSRAAAGCPPSPRASGPTPSC